MLGRLAVALLGRIVTLRGRGTMRCTLRSTVLLLRVLRLLITLLVTLLIALGRGALRCALRRVTVRRLLFCKKAR